MGTKENKPLMKVYAGTQWQAEIIKGLLEANNIPAMLADKSPTSAMMPDIGGSVLVLVNELDAPLAEKLIRENEKHVK